MRIECPVCKHKISEEYCFVCSNCNHQIPDLTPEEKANLRLEYQEINHGIRHIEIGWWGVGAILIPITFGVLYKCIGNLQVLIFGVFSILVLWWIYILFTKYVHMKELQLMDRAKEIEKLLDMKYIKYGDERRIEKVSKDCITKGNNTFFKKLNWLYKKLNWPYEKMPPNFRFYDFMYILCLVVSIVCIIMIVCQLKGCFALKSSNPQTVEQSETSEKLLKLPDGVEFPEDIRYKIRYDKAKQRLVFKGVMSKEKKLNY